MHANIAASDRVPLLATFSLNRLVKKEIANEQRESRTTLQREAEKRLRDEAARLQIAQRLSERMAKAEKREQENRLRQQQFRTEELKRLEHVKVKAKEEIEERVRLRGELQRQQIDDIEKKAKNKAMIEEEKSQQYKRKEEKYRKKVRDIKRYQSVQSKAESDKQLAKLNELEVKCTFVRQAIDRREQAD